jgi:Fe2+ transport system protein B
MFLDESGKFHPADVAARLGIGKLSRADLRISYLGRFGHALGPLGEWLGMDWRLVVALLSFMAKENAIATLGILYGGGEKE